MSKSSIPSSFSAPIPPNSPPSQIASCSNSASISISAQSNRPNKTLIILKHIAWAFLLFNALYASLLFLFDQSIAHLLIQFWPFILAYAASMAMAALAIKMNRPSFLWPMLLLKLPLILVPLAICLLFWARLVCGHFHAAQKDANFECPPGLFNRLESEAANSISPTSILPVFILFLIFAEKTGELIFFCLLMQKIRKFNRREVEMAEEAGVGGENGGGNGNGDSKAKLKRKRPKRWPPKKQKSKEIGGTAETDETEEEKVEGEEEGEETIFEKKKGGGGGRRGRCSGIPLPLQNAAFGRRII